MTDKQFYFCCQEVNNYYDKDAYISDLALSEIWEDNENLLEIPKKRLIELSNIWNAFHRSFSDIASITGISKRKLAEQFLIPYRTAEDWSSNKRHPPIYVLIMIQKILGLI